jgi:hypothetical protein
MRSNAILFALAVSFSNLAEIAKKISVSKREQACGSVWQLHLSEREAGLGSV